MANGGERIILNVGGRHFETTTSRLLRSGSRFFRKLLSTSSSSTSEHKDLTSSKPTHRQHAGSETFDEESSSLPQVLFIDRDGDIFEDVLSFMRTNKLRTRTRQSYAALEELKVEAEYYRYEALVSACEQGMQFSDRVLVNVSGRKYESDLTTLGGCDYFRKKLETGTCDFVTPQASESGWVQEIFIDCECDVFEDILHFLRTGAIRLQTRLDVVALDDLKKQAKRFAFRGLVSACKKATKRLLRDVKRTWTMPENTAKGEFCVVSDDEPTTICVEGHGKVLYIESAALVGTSEPEDCPDHKDSGDFKLMVRFNSYADNERICVARVSPNMCEEGTHNFRQDLRLCLGIPPIEVPDEESETTGKDAPMQQVILEATGSWHVIYWLGEPNHIPGLRDCASNKDRRREEMALEVDSDDDDLFLFALLDRMDQQSS